MLKMKTFILRVSKGSVVLNAFGRAGVRSSLFYRAVCRPYEALNSVSLGGRLQKAANASAAVKYITLERIMLTMIIAAPFCTEAIHIISAVLIAAFVFRCFYERGFAQKPREIDALIYLFTIVFYFAAGGFTASGALALLSYAVFISAIKDERQWKKLCFAFIVSSVVAAAAGLLEGSGIELLSEFYILIIPFGFIASGDFRKPYKSIACGCCVILCLIFLTVLSRGEYSLGAVALCVFLCLRDIRFVLPAAAVLAALSGFDILHMADGYGATLLSGGLMLFISGLLYINLLDYSSKRQFLRSVAAAIGSSGTVFLARGGQSNLGFIFWIFLSLVSTRINFKKTLA